MNRPLSFAHHHIAQAVPARRWTPLRVQGRTLFVPPAEGRASVWAEIKGFYGIPGRPKRCKVRLMRHKPGGVLDQTGIDPLVIPSVGRAMETVYTWNGHVQPDWPLTFEMWQDGRATTFNIAWKLDWLASEDDPL